jgi:hypothetical protein
MLWCCIDIHLSEERPPEEVEKKAVEKRWAASHEDCTVVNTPQMPSESHEVCVSLYGAGVRIP